MIRDRVFGVMAALAITLNALYVVANIFMSSTGVKYPFFSFGGSAALILTAFLYGPALIALAIWSMGQIGKSHAED